MRAFAIVALLVGCADQAPVEPELPQPLDAIWSRSIMPGDLIVAVPGTGGYTGLGAFVDAGVDAQHPIPMIDGRIDVNPIVLEQAIAAMQRAGFDDAAITGGAVTIGLWGAGVTKAAAFDYRSLDGLTVRIAVLGGESVCAVGALVQNLGHYNSDDADRDARD